MSRDNRSSKTGARQGFGHGFSEIGGMLRKHAEQTKQRNSQVQRHTVELAIDPSLRSSSDMRRAEHRPSMRELPTNICVPRHAAYNKSGNKTPQMVSYPPATSKVSKMKALDAAFQAVMKVAEAPVVTPQHHAINSATPQEFWGAPMANGPMDHAYASSDRRGFVPQPFDASYPIPGYDHVHPQYERHERRAHGFQERPSMGQPIQQSQSTTHRVAAPIPVASSTTTDARPPLNKTVREIRSSLLVAGQSQPSQKSSQAKPAGGNKSVSDLRSSMLGGGQSQAKPAGGNKSVSDLRSSMLGGGKSQAKPAGGNKSVSDLRSSMLGGGQSQAKPEETSKHDPLDEAFEASIKAEATEEDDYLYIDDEIDVKKSSGSWAQVAADSDLSVSDAVANAVAKVENEIAMEKMLIIQEAERLRSHVHDTRAEVLRRRQERTKLTNDAIDNTNEGMRQLYERMKLTSSPTAQITSPVSHSPIKICSPEGRTLSSTIQDLRVSLLAAAACDEAEEPISPERTSCAKQAVQQAEACLSRAEDRIQQLEHDLKLTLDSIDEQSPPTSERPVAEESAEVVEDSTVSAPVRSRPSRPKLGAPRRVTPAEEPVLIAAEEEIIEEEIMEEEDAESPEKEESSSTVTSPSQVLLPIEDLSEVNEKVVAGALLTISRELSGSSSEKCAAIVGALEAAAYAVSEAQGDVIGACPRCTTLLAVNLDVVSSVLQMNVPSAVLLAHSSQDHVIPVPLGMHRLMAVEIVKLLLHVYSTFTDNHLINAGVLELCFQLFFRYPKASILHTAVREIFDSILESPNEAIRAALINSECLVSQLCEAGHKQLPIPPGSRPVNTGHIIEMAEELAESNDPVLQRVLSQNATWTEFVSENGTLQQLLAQQCGGACGGAAPNTKSADAWNGPEGDKQREHDMKVLLGQLQLTGVNSGPQIA